MAEVDSILRDLQNSSYSTKAEFNNCFIIHSKYFQTLKGKKMSFIFNNFAPSNKNNTISSPAFFSQQFNNFQRAAVLTSF